MLRTNPVTFRIVLIVAVVFFMVAANPAAATDTTADTGTTATADTTDAGGAAIKEAAPQAPATTPEIAIAAPKYEFPTVLEGEYVTHTFVVANKGTAELKIHKVRTG